MRLASLRVSGGLCEQMGIFTASLLEGLKSQDPQTHRKVGYLEHQYNEKVQRKHQQWCSGTNRTIVKLGS